MTGLIQKSGYIRPGTGGGHYAEYIATREGVELLEAPRPSRDGSGYLEYMAERPRSHGLFSANGPADQRPSYPVVQVPFFPHLSLRFPNASVSYSRKCSISSNASSAIPVYRWRRSSTDMPGLSSSYSFALKSESCSKNLMRVQLSFRMPLRVPSSL